MTGILVRQAPRLLPPAAALALLLAVAGRAAAVPSDPSGATVQLRPVGTVPVMAAPDPAGAVVATLEPDDVVYLVGYARDANATLWYNVARDEGGALGWVMAANLLIENASVSESDIQAPPIEIGQPGQDGSVPSPVPSAPEPPSFMP